jgi:hypothetical protein
MLSPDTTTGAFDVSPLSLAMSLKASAVCSRCVGTPKGVVVIAPAVVATRKINMNGLDVPVVTFVLLFVLSLFCY